MKIVSINFIYHKQIFHREEMIREVALINTNSGEESNI